MNIVLFQSGSILGKQIIDTWFQKYSRSSEYQLVHNCSLDDLDTYHPKLVILASELNSDFEQSVLQKCRDLKVSILSVLGRGATVLLGPLERPGIPGCVTCLQLRFENTFERSLQTLFGPSDSAPVELSPPSLGRLGDIVTDEIRSLMMEFPTHLHSWGKVGVYEEDEDIEWVTILPSHDCPRCQLMPDDNPALAELQFTSHIVADAAALRVKNVDFEALQTSFMHTKVGYISAVNQSSVGDSHVRADACIYTPAGADIVGYGSGLSIIDAKQSAMLEVLERSCGFQAVNRRPVVFEKYSELGPSAVHPSKFGLHNYELLQSLHHTLEPFHEDTKYSWIWAYSTTSQSPVLVPEQIAFYGPTADERRFVTETSNGCAIGGTVEEAVLHGVFEVLERDGFLNMWYAKMPVPELRLGQHCPAKTSEAFNYLVEEGYQVRLFDVSHDLRIPAICAVAINTENSYPKVVSGSACHLNPYQAVSAALRELTVQVVNLKQGRKAKRKQAVSMLLDPKQITDILDHVAVSALPEAYPRWKFLLRQGNRRRVRTVEEVYTDVDARYQVNTRDIRLILGAVLEDLHRRGFDVIVVNQTGVEVSYGGLHAVKVLIPGMTPITFGYGLQRVRGLSRLYELPCRLGYRQRVLTEADMNLYCHPLS
ncbi:TOMM precursor leader peptide-binding protein [Alicyclobacillus ferrooxydans]|uniref:YcaO domain-containing protein n=1 Tax=Alicyclobacillus ferrooxydans TaxID=471514 RepID=A0A0P9GQH3_9BACL|nr:TOMM precursor leader peptide-binding protein [Alicyclobacillus ferrooxydans]KPV43066.1 hypothetical protein AN477_14050 [Alicyclobacillus ferrooxydans]